MRRRNFIGTCAACSVSLAIPAFRTSFVMDSDGSLNGISEKTKIKLIFAYPSSKDPIWPNIGYDFEKRKKELIVQFQQCCPDVIFDTVDAMKNEDAALILRSSQDTDGYIVYLVGCLWGNVTETIASSGKPAIIIDDLFAGSGEFLTSFARIKREGHPVIGVSSSDFDDVVKAVRAVSGLKKLKYSTMLVVGGAVNEAIIKEFGTKVLVLDYAELNQAYKNIKPAEAGKWADYWIKNAEKVIEPSRKDIERAGAMYVSMLNLMKHYSAQGIAVHCL